MAYKGFGRIIKGVGGLFTVWVMPSDGEAMPLDNKTVVGRGRGNLHRKGVLLAGDRVEISYDDSSYRRAEDGTVTPAEDGTGISIDRILDRSCALIRPPMANLDVLFVTIAAAAPDPVLETVDKLISIAEYNGIEPVIVITKSEIAPKMAAEIKEIYTKAGFLACCVGEGIEGDLPILQNYIQTSLGGKVAAFSGASGVGKSTLLNRLFPNLMLQTGEISRRIERGKNTTRHVELYPLSEDRSCGFLADTPGFTMLDFERFDFFDKESLPETFREFLPLIGSCRYTKCSHTVEQGCAICEAVASGEIAKSRHASFCALYDVLKKKTKW